MVLDNYFFIYKWDASSIPYLMYTERGLRYIHRAFGHPSVSSIHNLLKKASSEHLDRKVRLNLKQISDDCSNCRNHSTTPERFKLTIGMENLDFNHHISDDTMFLDGRPVLHIVDESTNFTAASFLKSQSSSEIGKGILRSLVHTYMPPDFQPVDQGSASTSLEFKGNDEALGIKMREAPIKTSGAIGVVERYHAPLHRSFNKVGEMISKDQASDNECLRMAVFSVNSTMGLEGSVPMLLVFGALLRRARTTSQPTATPARD